MSAFDTQSPGLTRSDSESKLPPERSPTLNQAFVSEEILEACGIEAVGNGSLSCTEIALVYGNIKRAVAFVSRLNSHLGPECLVSELLDKRGRRQMRWSKVGLEFIQQLHRARQVLDILSCLTPSSRVLPEVRRVSIEDQGAIPSIAVPVLIPFLRPHPCIQALVDASPFFEKVFGNYGGSSPAAPTKVTHKYLSDAFRTFVAPAKLAALKRAADNSRRNCNKSFNSLRRYLAALLQRYRRLLVVRLDLYYRQPYARDSRICTHQRISADRVQLLKLIRRNYPAFVGYAWKLEIGVQRHWHLHTLLCFDGNAVRLDAVIGRRLGDAWVALTKGQGDYHNCNGKRRDYKHDAIGMIHADNAEEVDMLMRYPVTYLTKTPYYASIELAEAGRSFGKGQLPADSPRERR